MTILSALISIDKKLDIPAYMQVANALVLAIRQGRLAKGIKLPGSRELADTLHIHRKTVVAAYEELQAQGWIEMASRKGTFVTLNLPDIKPRKIKAEEQVLQYPKKTVFAFDEKDLIRFPFGRPPAPGTLVIDDGFPDMRLMPAELFIRELRSVTRQKGFRKYYGYGNPKGTVYLRDTLSAFLSETRGLAASPENLLITRGAQMGIYLAGKLLIKPGDHVVVGEPGYFGATLTLQQVGATINRVPVDEHGIDVNAIEALCQRKIIRIVYVIPHHHHPTTVTLTPERRMRLLELAAKYKFAIIEDDYDYDFHYTSNPVLPMASLDHHGSVIYIGTLSKTLAPAIRTGFMMGPGNFIEAVSHLRCSIDRQGDSLIEVAIAGLYRNGDISRHIKKVVKLYRERRDHFCQLLTDQLGKRVLFKIPDGGMSVWTTFVNADLKKLSAKAATKGLAMSDGSIYSVSPLLNASRLGFASLNFKEQERAVDILGKCL